MNLEGAQQADDPMGYALGDIGQWAELRNRSVGEPVQSTADLFEETTVAKGLQVCSRNAVAVVVEVRDPPGEQLLCIISYAQ